MAAQIGKLNLKLVVSPEQLVAGLDAAAQRVKTFVGTAIVSFKRMVNVGGMIEDVFDQTFGSILKADSVFSKIDDMAKFADRVGLSTEALAGFEHAADLSGVKIENFRKALEENLKILGQAQAAGQKTALTFERFGVKVDDLLSMNMEDRVHALADAYNRIKSPVDRSAFAIANFGGEAQKVQKFLEAGSEGLRKIRENAEKFGLTFSRLDAAGIERARDAVTELQAVFEGVKRQVAIQLAPLIGTIAEKLSQFIKDGPGVTVIVKNVASAIFDIVDAILASVEAIAKMASKVRQEMRTAGVGLNITTTGRLPGRDEIAGMMGGGPGADLQLGRIRTLINEYRAGLNDLAIGVPKPGLALLKDMNDLADGLQAKIDAFGKSALDLQLEGFLARVNPKAADQLDLVKRKIDEIRTLDREFKELGFIEDLRKRAGDLEKSLLTPFDNLRTKVKEIRLMTARGFLSPKAAEQLEAMAAMDAAKSLGGIGANLAAGLQEGSAEAISAINRNMAEMRNNPNAKVEGLLVEVKRQLMEGDKREQDLLTAIAGALQGGNQLPP